MVQPPPCDLDIQQFQWIESQTNDNDRRALLSIREAVCRDVGAYHYLEVGSHLGGSLQPHVIDSRCRKIYSIDPRPLEQPDERWVTNYKYNGNSTQRMLDLLARIPGADLSKLFTFELSSWEISAISITPAADFAFLDGEHVNSTVIRDFHAVKKFLSPSSILAFHDSFIVPKAILRIRRELRRKGIKHGFYYFPDSTVVAITFDPDRFTETLVCFGWQTKRSEERRVG